MRRFIIYMLLGFPTVCFSQKILTLNDAISIALKNNYDIQIAKNESDINKVNNTPGNAGLLPTLALNGSATVAENDLTQRLSGDIKKHFVNLKSNTLTADIQLNWNIFDGGKMFITKRKLNEIQSLGELTYKNKVQQTIFSVIKSYYDVVRQQQQLKSLQEAMNYNKERITITEAGYNAGTQFKNALLQSKIDYNVTFENVINQQFNIEISLKELKNLLASSSMQSYDIQDTIPPSSIPSKDSLFNKLVSSNINLLELQKQIDIANLTLKENRSAYLPIINLKGGYYLSRNSNSEGSTLTSRSNGPQVIANLSIPIYNAGETKRKNTVAKIESEIAKTDYKNAQNELINELDNILKEYDYQQQMLVIESENKQMAQENYQVCIDRLRQGQSTSLEVHQAQQSYIESFTRLINFRYNLKMIEMQIKQMIGIINSDTKL